MPFDYKTYTLSCQNWSTPKLQKEWENYTCQISGSSTSTAVSIIGAPFTFGVSLVNLAFVCPRIDNARHKRAIIEATLVSRGEGHHTRKRDVILPVTLGTVIGFGTLGLAPIAADATTNVAVAECVAVVAANPHFVGGATELVLEAANDGVEAMEAEKKKRKEGTVGE